MDITIGVWQVWILDRDPNQYRLAWEGLNAPKRCAQPLKWKKQDVITALRLSADRV